MKLTYIMSAYFLIVKPEVHGDALSRNIVTRLARSKACSLPWTNNSRVCESSEDVLSEFAHEAYLLDEKQIITNKNSKSLFATRHQK